MNNPVVLDVMLSYAYHSKTDLYAMRCDLGDDAVMMVDSGAFTAHSKGKPIDMVAYSEFLSRWAGVYDHAITLDVIGDPKGTAVNTDRLWSLGHDVMPVFTVGEDFAQFDRWAKQGHTFVCAGGLVGMNRKALRPYLKAVAQRARASGVHVHALGVGGTRLLAEAGVYSGDSSAATQAPAFGSVCGWSGSNVSQTMVSDRVGLLKHRDWFAGLGMPFADLLTGSVFGEGQKSVRDQVVAAGLYAFTVAGHWMRNTYPTDGGPGKPGPRLLAAASTGDTAMVRAVGERVRTDPPRSVRRETRVKESA